MQIKGSNKTLLWSRIRVIEINLQQIYEVNPRDSLLVRISGEFELPTVRSSECINLYLRAWSAWPWAWKDGACCFLARIFVTSTVRRTILGDPLFYRWKFWWPPLIFANLPPGIVLGSVLPRLRAVPISLAFAMSFPLPDELKRKNKDCSQSNVAWSTLYILPR